MCMIAYHPAGAGTLTQPVISTAMTRHPDGFGFMWRDTSGTSPVVRVAQFAPADRSKFIAALAPVIESGSEYAVHFRFGTSGPKSADMAHPFVYTDPDGQQVAVMHNGVIGIAHDRQTESDTSAFVRLVLERLPSQWWDNPALVYLVREAIGYSKLTIMTAERTVIVGEEKGEWVEGIWYSSDHKPSSFDGKYSWSASKPSGLVTSPHISDKAYKGGTKADPNSKRSAKRAAAAAARAAKRGVKPVQRGLTVVPLVTPDTAYVPDDGYEPVTYMTHLGHKVSALQSMPLHSDGDFDASIICEECQTTGDVYVIDGQRYIDLAHLDTTPTYTDALAAVGM